MASGQLQQVSCAYLGRGRGQERKEGRRDLLKAGIEFHFKVELGCPLNCLFSQISFLWPETPLCCQVRPLGHSSWIFGYRGSSMRPEGQAGAGAEECCVGIRCCSGGWAAVEPQMLGISCLLWFSSCESIRRIPLPVQGKLGFPEVGTRK